MFRSVIFHSDFCSFDENAVIFFRPFVNNVEFSFENLFYEILERLLYFRLVFRDYNYFFEVV